MSGRAGGAVTQLLLEWSQGDQSALERLIPLVYAELRRIARAYMRRELAGHTLQTTALINEAYLRLIDQSVPWQSRAHFFGVAARLMRQILVDHARAQHAAKRGGHQLQVSLSDAAEFPEAETSALIALDDALKGLAAIDPRTCQVVELRYFGGLSIAEAAEALGVSHTTVERDWKVARAWLRREMTK
ncbi:MAG TPA: sigma-70 family RNA polymerase sigma factor [Blastocatellia bacterium]|nr:sigma-70 family RNA polymerase sigma factor [Blastocatellia bacterium]